MLSADNFHADGLTIRFVVRPSIVGIKFELCVVKPPGKYYNIVTGKTITKPLNSAVRVGFDGDNIAYRHSVSAIGCGPKNVLRFGVVNVFTVPESFLFFFFFSFILAQFPIRYSTGTISK